MSQPARSEIDPDRRWDLDGMYEDQEAWEQAYEDTAEQLQQLEQYGPETVEDPEELKEFLDTTYDIGRKIQQLSVYAKANRDVAAGDQQHQANLTKVSSLSSERGQAMSFLRPALREQGAYTDLTEEEPGLEEYQGLLAEVERMAEHSLSSDAADAMAQVGEAFGTGKKAYNRLTDSDMEAPVVEGPDGDEIEVTPARVGELLKHPDREFRQRVWEARYEPYEDHADTIAAMLEGTVTEHSRKARMRGHDSSIEAALKPKDVPEDVYDSLVEVVMEHNDQARWEQELREEVLEVDELEPWDMRVPIYGEEPDISYEEAQDIILDAMEPLGDEYVSILETAFEEDWIDVEPHEGKRNGAYSTGAYDANPLVLMNFNEDLSSLYTMAHELGHAVNRYLSQEEQPFHEATNDIFVAEVASTFNEQLLTDHLLDTEDDEMRMHALKYGINRIESLLFTQGRFAAFEQKVHEAKDNNEPLTADRLDSLYESTFAEPEEAHDLSKGGWKRIKHFFRPFYVYQYATGVSAAISLADDVIEGGEEEREQYMDFLAAGSTDKPVDLLDDAGVDMTSPEPVYEAVWKHHELTEELLDMVEVVDE